MTDASHEPFEARAPDPAPEFEPAHIELLEMVANVLADDLDHPEVWQLLAEFGAMDGAAELIDTVSALRAMQADRRSAKALDLIGGVLGAANGDRAASLAKLKQLEAAHGLCPQVAGACFFVNRLGDPDRSADLSERFCSSPFIKFETLVDGTVAPCCSIWTKQRLGRLDSQTFAEIWNSDEAQAMRASILDGSFRYCNKQRCAEINDDLLPLRAEVTDPALRRIIDERLTWLDTKPSWLFLAHDATCNLACPSCRAGLEIASAEQEARFDKILGQVFHPLLAGSADGAGPIKVSLSGQGDPWSSQHYRAILRYMADHPLDAELSIYTNAQLMGEKRWAEYKGLERYQPLVSVSVDAASPWVYEHLRRPGKWDKLEENLRFIADLRVAGSCGEFGTNATVQLDNFHELGKLVDLAEGLGCDWLRLYMIQNTGVHLADSYDAKNVADERHPLHLAFLESLRDPKLARPVVQMYDVATWREMALAARLPSDDLGADYSRDELTAALRTRIEGSDFAGAAALCAAGRLRWPGDAQLLAVEAAVLEGLGLGQQAQWRRNMAAGLPG